MNSDLEEQQEIENTIKRADQITAAVKSFEKTEFEKQVISETEDDIINKEEYKIGFWGHCSRNVRSRHL